MKVKEEREKAGLKINIQKTKIMASGPSVQFSRSVVSDSLQPYDITSWQTDAETMQTVTDFIFLDCKITGDGHCSHEIKRCLLLGRKAMTSRDRILKRRDITLPTEVHLVKATVFPVVMYGCES